MTTELPTSQAIFDRYLADNATDAKGKKYVFENGEPDHFKLLECVLADFAEPGRFEDDEDFAAEIDEVVTRAEDIYTDQFEDEPDGSPDEAQEWHDYDPDC